MSESGTTYVLVHGSWHSGRCWDRVVPLLASAGHRVFAPSLTGHGDRAHMLGPDIGLETCVDDVVGLVLEKYLTRVVLVGHSYAGAVISAVANRIPDRIASLVYVDAVVPDDGESAVDVLPSVFQPLIDRAAETDTGWRVPPPPEMPPPVGLFGVTDAADIAWLRTTLSDQSVRCWQDPVRLDNPAVSTIPRTHIHCVEHPRAAARRPVPPVQPDGTPAQVWELATGHDCMITMPNELAELLLKVRTVSEPLEGSL